MKTAMGWMTTAALAAALVVSATSAASADPLLEEHVTGGALDLVWVNGYDTANNMLPLTLASDHVAYANPSGDHTVAVATNADPQLGGLIVTTVSTTGVNNYSWEAWMFTGDGNSRRGLIFRCSPAENVKTFYQFILESGMLRLRLRKLVAPSQVSSILGEWFTTALPGGLPAINSWHHLKVVATNNTFQLFWDGVDVNGGPVVDAVDPLMTGNVGCYNFSPTGITSVYFDDLVLESLEPTSTRTSSWGAIKKLYR